jgi:hypothetical protein
MLTSRRVRRDLPPGAASPGAQTHRRQARPGAGQGVPESRGAVRAGHLPRHQDWHTPRRDPLPLLANIASVLDEHFAQIWQTDMATRVDRARRRRHGLATYRVVRYADDFVVMVCGSRRHAEAIREQIIPVLASVGLRLSEEKTTIIHLDEGFEFLGFRIQCKPNGARAADTSTPGSRNGRSPRSRPRSKRSPNNARTTH